MVYILQNPPSATSQWTKMETESMKSEYSDNSNRLRRGRGTSKGMGTYGNMRNSVKTDGPPVSTVLNIIPDADSGEGEEVIEAQILPQVSQKPEEKNCMRVSFNLLGYVRHFQF